MAFPGAQVNKHLFRSNGLLFVLNLLFVFYLLFQKQQTFLIVSSKLQAALTLGPYQTSMMNYSGKTLPVCAKIRTRITPNTDPFYAVIISSTVQDLVGNAVTIDTKDLNILEWLKVHTKNGN